MTETPKCPYCGAEMKRSTGRYLDGRYRSRYCCPKCDACAPLGTFYERLEDAEAASLTAALRRAEPENRVLTMEELEEHCKRGKDAEPLWVELRKRQELSRWMIANAPEMVVDSPRIADWLHSNGNVYDYNKTWRCWLRKPTAEEMGREKWEE